MAAEDLPRMSAPIVDANGRRWTLGMLNVRDSLDVPGSILLLTKKSSGDEPSSMREDMCQSCRSSIALLGKKRTPDGRFVLEPQPDDSPNDPLTWKTWRRDAALVALGWYSMIGGGMTSVLAAGFTEIATEFNTNDASVALTTGLYLFGLGMGSIFLSPTAIIWGKRPVYLAAAICFIGTSAACALSPNLSSLIISRVCMGITVSSVECLPSASISEIYFLHERAYRLGIYTLLLLSGKNLIPLVSAVIIQAFGWRWVFWVVCITIAFAWGLLFLLVPETFWDRTLRFPRDNRALPDLNLSCDCFPTPDHERARSRANSLNNYHIPSAGEVVDSADQLNGDESPERHQQASPKRLALEAKDAFNKNDLKYEEQESYERKELNEKRPLEHETSTNEECTTDMKDAADGEKITMNIHEARRSSTADLRLSGEERHAIPSHGVVQPTPTLVNIPLAYIPSSTRSASPIITSPATILEQQPQFAQILPSVESTLQQNNYTESLRRQPPRPFIRQLGIWPGRLTKDRWLRIAMRPFVLFAYPAIVWSSLVYALSIGWLIVLSESIAQIYESKHTYNFNALQTGLVYISPFVAGILGTAVAGRISDNVVRALARSNGGVYEPEFRLVMAIPITLTTTVGLMGFGWSAAERDFWLVPAIFFGFISFGCSLGAATAITFAVDSYKQYAGEALVTLNFCKNVGHGLVFSLFFNRWLTASGSKTTFVAVGCIQLACLLTTIPMYIYGKRARMWTMRKNFMAKF